MDRRHRGHRGPRRATALARARPRRPQPRPRPRRPLAGPAAAPAAYGAHAAHAAPAAHAPHAGGPCSAAGGPQAPRSAAGGPGSAAGTAVETARSYGGDDSAASAASTPLARIEGLLRYVVQQLDALQGRVDHVERQLRRWELEDHRPAAPGASGGRGGGPVYHA